MARSRSKSPRRDKRKRTRSKSRERDRERDRDKERERRRHHGSRSPHSKSRRTRSPRRRHRSRRSRSGSVGDDVIYTGTSHISEEQQKIDANTNKPRSKNKNANKDNKQNGEASGVTEDELAMMKAMGFASFDTTKGKKVNGADVSCVNLVQKRKYRQYMNRRGGFNRPLDFVA